MTSSTRYDDGFCQMFVGDATEVLSELPEKSIHTCVTSPPYFGLRSYLASDHPEKAREGGTQETPGQYVQWLVEVFRGVWRVLRDDGTVWLNLGDSYNSGASGGLGGSTLGGGQTNQANSNRNGRRVFSDLKPKDLLMIPARVALALQADGWYLRSQIVWAKPNPMPESVTDRPTQATEMVYLLTKKPRYFYDAEAVKEPGTSGPSDIRKMEESLERIGGKHKTLVDPLSKAHAATNIGQKRAIGQPGARNLRNYWQISTRPYPGSHYATFPPELPLRAVKAGTSEHGVCSECGAPWRRVVERGELQGQRVNPGQPAGQPAHHPPQGYLKNGKSRAGVNEFSRTIGFEPTCSHFPMQATGQGKENSDARPNGMVGRSESGVRPPLDAISDEVLERETDGRHSTGEPLSGNPRHNPELPGGQAAGLVAATVIPATVLDPFSGSGTTGLVARKLGRRSVLIDLDDRNVRLLEQRMGYQGVLC